MIRLSKTTSIETNLLLPISFNDGYFVTFPVIFASDINLCMLKIYVMTPMIIKHLSLLGTLYANLSITLQINMSDISFKDFLSD